MFIVVAQRREFLDKWVAILSGRGMVSTAEGLPALQAALQAKKPQAVIIDGTILGAVAPGFLAVIKRLCGDAGVLLGDTRFSAEEELLALAAGMAACCDARLDARSLEHVLAVVLDGGVWLSQSALPELVQRLGAPVPADGAATPAADGLAGLTDRQRAVAELVAQGASNKAIARQLDITERTVKAHLTTIFDKLGFADRLQLALYVTRRPLS